MSVVMCSRYVEPNQVGGRFIDQAKFCSFVCQVFFPGYIHLIDLSQYERNNLGSGIEEINKIASFEAD